MEDIFGYAYGSFVLEVTEDCPVEWGKYCWVRIGDKGRNFLLRTQRKIPRPALQQIYEDRLGSAFIPATSDQRGEKAIPNVFLQVGRVHCRTRLYQKPPSPRVLIPVFPGTNCEYDSAKAVRPTQEPKLEIFVINNLTRGRHRPQSVQISLLQHVRESQIIFIPGGFSGGDEPDGSGKFITAFFRNGEVREDRSARLLDRRDGLMLRHLQRISGLGQARAWFPIGEIVDAGCAVARL